jgi:hypothetical protein
MIAPEVIVNKFFCLYVWFFLLVGQAIRAYLDTIQMTLVDIRESQKVYTVHETHLNT